MAGTMEPRPLPTKAEVLGRIDAYAQRNHIHYTPVQRESLATLQMQQPTERRAPTHPYGGYVKEGDERHSAGNRAQVKFGLHLYFDNGQPVTLDNGVLVPAPYRGTPLALQQDDVGGALADQLNQRRDAATGMELADRVVSRFELAAALQGQHYRNPTQALFIHRRFCLGWSIEQMCREGGHHKSVYYEREAAAIDALIDSIYVTSFTEAKSQDQYEEGQRSTNALR